MARVLPIAGLRIPALRLAVEAPEARAERRAPGA
jgi:hypothetical protein